MITIVGGTYRELCFEPYWNEIFGSGLRACHAIHRLAPNETLEYFTFCDSITSEYIKLSPFIICNASPIDKNISFYYDHPLITPRIHPRPDTIDISGNAISVTADDALLFGMIEGRCNIRAKRLVYDPQSPANPIAFSATKSNADQLAYVINIHEAKILSKKDDISDVKRFFFEEENASVLVLKMGPRGALVVLPNGEENAIPVYQTPHVWPIGSGDVFAAIFAFRWFQSGNAIAAANEASWQTASYCNSRDFQFSEQRSRQDFVPMLVDRFIVKTVYLAGPFFKFTDRWLIDQIRTSLLGLGLQVFSPFHDVGHGIASEVVKKDLEALDRADIIFSVLDGLDSGTLFEVGYAVCKGKAVIGYVENESTESVKMLEGTSCNLEKDLTTSIYKCYWELFKNE
jgi:nucleoside 2-deoxyribosyltransferase